MNDLKQLVEDFIDYTKEWSITETEWYYNVDCTRKNVYGKEYITNEDFERAIREELLYEFIYNIDGIKQQMENDLDVGYDEERFGKISREMEKTIQKIFKDFKLERR